ncbi:hypothetical protein PAXRUDRAFT_149432, partial [Paxillus rubicundulus Ve08.2h10]
GMLPFWALQYWMDLEQALIAKECWLKATQWLSHLDVTSFRDLQAIVNEVSCNLQLLGWGESLLGPAAGLSMQDLAEFLAATPMKGWLIDAMMGKVAGQFQANAQLQKSTSIQDLTFVDIL